MGLFDKIVQTVKETGLADAIDKTVDKLQESGGFKDAAASAPAQATYGPGAAPPAAPQAPAEEEGGHTVAYFREVISGAFPQYQLLEGVSPAQLGGTGRPYDFALVSGGAIVAVIPLAEHNRTNNMAWKNARAAAESAGVPFINFHLHMPNKRDFVVGRINRLLG